MCMDKHSLFKKSNMKRILINAIILFTISTQAFAQKTVTGKVTDAVTGNPLQGATITLPGKGGVTSDNNGSFSFECGKAVLSLRARLAFFIIMIMFEIESIKYLLPG